MPLGPDAALPAVVPPPRGAERRYITVLFCDLMDSMWLVDHLDPEDVQEVMRVYHQTCEAVIRRFDGFVDQYVGDVVVACFGYPLAHEDDAQRAVRAGLGILEALDALVPPPVRGWDPGAAGLRTLGSLAHSLAAATEKMDKAISVLKDELAGVRTGRATPALLQRIVVDYYGTQVPIQQLASFSVPEPRTLMITPYDKNAISAMEKAIMASDLGITPGNDGSVIRLSFPPLTEERRKELIKLVHHRGEEARVAVRNVRRHSKDELERLEREGGISEDDLVRSEKELQKLTDKHVADIDDVVSHKDAELKEI